MFAFRTAHAALAAIAAFAGVLSLQPNSAHAGMLAPIWTGAYAGFQTGGTWGSIDSQSFSNIDTSAFTVGGHAGFNMSFGVLVAGVEGDLNYDGSSGTYLPLSGGAGKVDTNWSGTLRGRVGLPVGPALLYATAGFAWTGKTVSERLPGGGSFSSDHTFNGVVYGLGAETYVLPNLSVRLEALRYDYSSDKLSLSGAAAAVREIDPSDTVVRAGVTFHLN